jgi:hypothetical protein
MLSAASVVISTDACVLTPSPSNQKYLREWLEAADYAAQALVMMAGLVGLDAGVIPPPEGESSNGCQCDRRPWPPVCCLYLPYVLCTNQHVSATTTWSSVGSFYVVCMAKAFRASISHSAVMFAYLQG